MPITRVEFHHLLGAAPARRALCAGALALCAARGSLGGALPEPERLSAGTAAVSRTPASPPSPFVHRGVFSAAVEREPDAAELIALLAAEGGLPPRVAATFTDDTADATPSAGRISITAQRIDGIPVWDSARIVAVRRCPRGGTLLYASFRGLDPDPCAAVIRESRALRGPRAESGGGEPVLLAASPRPRLALLSAQAGGAAADAALVFADPDGGAPFARYPLWRRHSACVAAHATPGELPDTPENPPVLFALPGLLASFQDAAGARIGPALTDREGCLGAAPPEAGFVAVEGLRGPFLTVTAEDAPPLSGRIACGDAVLVLNDPPAPAQTAQVNVFLHIGAARDFVAAYLPDCPVLTRPLSARVNVRNLPCNALYGAGVLEFGAARDPCAAAAFSTVIHHEFSHALTSSLTPVPPETALDEGLADAFTVLLNDDPRIACGLGGGAGGRDVSARLLRWPNDVTADPHATGLIVAGAWWRLNEALADAEGESGRALARRLFFDSLSLRPSAIGPELGWALLFLDDDNADLSDGTPHLRQIAASFGAAGLLPPPWQSVMLVHTPPPDPPLGARPVLRVRAHGAPLAAPPRVRYCINGGRAREFSLVEQYGGMYTGSFPPLDAYGLVSYAVLAEDVDGVRIAAPYAAAAGDAFHLLVGRTARIIEESFDAGAGDWRHAALTGLDEWMIGPIASPRGQWDPPRASSPPACAGIDLGGPGRDGDYRPGGWSYLRSPAIARPPAGRTVLEFARWLSVAEGDEAWIAIRGRTVWTSGGAALNDHAWARTCIDLTDFLPEDDAFELEFALKAAAESPARGGWHIDDLSILAVTPEPSFVRGDATGSGSVRIDDAVKILAAAFGAPLACPDAADVDDDGTMSIADAIALLAYLFAGGAAPPEPFPSSGTDPSPDSLGCEVAPAPSA
ncbi:MAG TPA: hypothetical protein DCM87_17430 [Planctomycetes bacterium]|nr:hypothetical protein [Planctomycetota bacterium]